MTTFFDRYDLFKRFTHFHSVGFTLILPLIGFASAMEPGSTWRVDVIGRLLSVGIAFHLFAYLQNDIIDVEIDRHDPRRQQEPLVTGLIRPRQAWFMIGGSLVIAGAFHGTLPYSGWTTALLLAAFGLMTVYNTWGKRMNWPPLTDLAQGASWSTWLLYGASIGSRVTPVTGLLAVSILPFIMVVNGIHGGLRDLKSDTQAGARTTAIWLGFAYNRHGMVCPPRAVLYALIWQVCFTGLLAAPILFPGAASTFGRFSQPHMLLSLLCASNGLFILVLLAPGRFNIEIPVVAYTTVTLLAPLSLLGPLLAQSSLILMGAVYLAPLMTEMTMWLLPRVARTVRRAATAQRA